MPIIQKNNNKITIYNKFVITRYSYLSILKSNSKKDYASLKANLLTPRTLPILNIQREAV